MWDDRRVVARYRRGDDEVERPLEPYGLVLKAGVWYLCARVADRDAFRVYRIDRFTAVERQGEERFVRDEGFDLPAFWDERAEQFARSILRAEVVVRLSADGARRLPYAVDPAAAREALKAADAPPNDDGWVTVTLPVESEEVARGQLAELGPEVEVRHRRACGHGSRRTRHGWPNCTEHDHRSNPRPTPPRTPAPPPPPFRR